MSPPELRFGNDLGYSPRDIDIPPSKIDYLKWRKTRETKSLTADKILYLIFV
jgi:hypothetical protein